MESGDGLGGCKLGPELWGDFFLFGKSDAKKMQNTTIVVTCRFRVDFFGLVLFVMSIFVLWPEFHIKILPPITLLETKGIPWFFA